MDFAELIAGMITEGNSLVIPVGIDYFSVLAGVLTGSLFACERKLDIIGTVVLGLVTGFGGGIIRDLLMQHHGIYFTSHPDLIVLGILIGSFVFYFRGAFKSLDATVFLADALSVGLFALAGASKAFACDQGFVLSVILGAITAVGGGALRDICVGETPGIFQQSNYYAVAGLAGSLSYVALAYAGCPLAIAGVVCVAIVVLLRYWSVRFDLRTKSEADYAPRVTAHLGNVRAIGRIFSPRDAAKTADEGEKRSRRERSDRAGTAPDADNANEADDRPDEIMDPKL